MMPLAINNTPINELQPGTTRSVLPVNHNASTYVNWMNANAKKTKPELNPIYKGIREKEKTASDANRNIFPNEYFDLPPIRSG